MESSSPSATNAFIANKAEQKAVDLQLPFVFDNSTVSDNSTDHGRLRKSKVKRLSKSEASVILPVEESTPSTPNTALSRSAVISSASSDCSASLQAGIPCSANIVQAIATQETTNVDERPYKCGTCGKSFAKKINLTMHHRIHKNVRPFSCTICNKSFRTRQHLTRHDSTHKKLTYKDICDFQMQQASRTVAKEAHFEPLAEASTSTAANPTPHSSFFESLVSRYPALTKCNKLAYIQEDKLEEIVGWALARKIYCQLPILTQKLIKVRLYKKLVSILHDK